MKNLTQVDFCVVGGGLAGMCAAISAARRGVKVVLMQDRPVLGGNASSEIRMHICGAHGPNNRETGIIEEIALENRYRNPLRNYALWDSILYEKVRFEPNITLLLNCSCNDATMNGNTIESVKGWQLTTETWHTVEAGLFADCSGDSILAPLTGAEFRIGREARAEFDEDIEPEAADRKTMGMSCLIQARETDRPQPFIPPAWANVYETDADLPHRGHDILKTNFWWIELGGEQDSIHDTESIRDELLKVAFGVWDHVKNRGDHGAENWVLEWVGFLPGKRESRRYVGDYVMTQNDVRAQGRFDDLVAYGGWTMDDHHPDGIRWPGEPTIFHPAPSPFGIPYRCLYSRSIENLFCAGRNISVTHAAMSATRVMATCATVGQAVGTAAAIAVREKLTPRDVYKHRIDELKQALMDDDCYLPWNARRMPALTRQATLTASSGDPEPLRNGLDRPIDDATSGWRDNGWRGQIGDWVQYAFDTPQPVGQMRFVFDSDLNRPEMNQPSHYPLHAEPVVVPQTLVKAFRIEALDEDGHWRQVARVDNNYQRLVRLSVDSTTRAVRFIPESTWGAAYVHLFAWDVINLTHKVFGARDDAGRVL
ncbi:MAG: FAD-dependent oxidoreductase [Anaerolineae bacterium]|nr:FAD-dependent oxidoreductase [Anaerolineae bacterium]